MDSTVREKVLAIYDWADAKVVAAGPKCEASGRCCRFSEYGHTLYLSEIEAEVLLETAPAYDAVSAASCPFLVNNLCVAREERPLGCRVYFCDPSFKNCMQDIMEAGIGHLKRITQEAGTQWRYAPLHIFLQEALEAGRNLSNRDREDAKKTALRDNHDRISLV
jgi:Fe-S-cluster containining protein